MTSRARSLAWGKKGAMLLLVALLALSLALPASAQDIIWEEREEEPVTKGVTYERQWRFSRDGWLRIHILEVETQDPDLKFETLYNEDGLPSARPLPELARQRDAVAAINTDFFYRQGNYLAPVGPVVSEEKGLVANANSGGNTGVLAIDRQHQVLIDYWRSSGQLRLPGGEMVPLAGLNKPGSTYARPIAYTSEWGSRSPTASADTITLVARNDRVASVGSGSKSIPEDGFAVVAGADGDYARAIKGLSAGDSVSLNYETTPDWENFVHATGGGGIIVRDGQVVREGHQTAGRHPRSAAGVTQDQSKLYLVAVDGRQEGSMGLTQWEMGQLLRSLGAYQAINLDGGGSTTLLARPLGQREPEVRNVPSDGSPRSVVSGLGVKSTAAPGEASNLLLEARDTNVPREGSRSLEIRAFDHAYNPASLPSGSPQWEVEPGDLGRVQDRVFIPESSGRGTITVNWGGLSADLDVRVLGGTRQIQLDPPSVSLSPGDQQVFTARAVDARGYSARVENRDLEWSVTGNAGSVSDGRFTAASDGGSGAVVARLGDVEGGAGVGVGYRRSSVESLDSTAGLEFLSWPEAVDGDLRSTEPPDPPPERGGAAVALDYDFSETVDDGARSAYLQWEGDGLALPRGTEMLSLRVHGDGQGHWLRGRIRDAAGNQESIDFSHSVDWTGWEKVEAQVPAELQEPLYLERLWLAETDSEQTSTGSVYLADLEALEPRTPDPEEVPETEVEDEARMDRAADATGTSFLVLGNIDPGVDARALARTLEGAKGNHNASFAVSSGMLPSGLGEAAPLVDVGARPRVADQDGTRLAFMRAEHGGIRTTSSNQWFWLREQLEDTGSEPLFFFLDYAPFRRGEEPGANFQDRHEAELFRRLLSEHQEDTDRDLWVFSGGLERGHSPWWRLQEGVRYLGVPPVQNAREFSYLAVTLTGDGPRYQVHQADAETGRPAVTVTVNGQNVDFPDVKPRIENGRTLVPLRGVFEAMGADVTWDQETRTVTTRRGDDLIELVVGQEQMLVNDETVVLDVPGRIENGRTLVPLRAISEGLGDEVDWDQDTRTVIINLR